jgi:dienelactone hydrolase
MSGRRILALVLGAVGITALVAAVLGVVWLAAPQPLLPEAEAALQSTTTVTVTDDDGTLTFTPVASANGRGLVFYPGGKVLPAAYAPAAQQIADAGYVVVIPSMPLNLAVLGSGTAGGIIAEHPEIEAWAIGGHSLGGAMAGQYLADNPGAAEGLVLWAAYPAASVADQPIVATSIYGTLDNGVPGFTSPETRAKLPADTVFVPIEGGNHEQMGWYTGQPNDPPATITREDQQAQAVAATLELLARLAPLE